MIVEMARYIGVIDLCATKEAEVLYPFQRRLGVNLPTLSESQNQSYSELKTEIFSLVAQPTENLHILFVISQMGTQKISVVLQLIGQIIMASPIPDDQMQDNFTIKVFAGGFPHRDLRHLSGTRP